MKHVIVLTGSETHDEPEVYGPFDRREDALATMYRLITDADFASDASAEWDSLEEWLESCEEGFVAPLLDATRSRRA
jgi:hypothetical protein